jgi:hypothetical protein
VPDYIEIELCSGQLSDIDLRWDNGFFAVQ